MGEGDDSVQLAATLNFLTLIDLGEGKNTLVNGAGRDEVFAGAGHDRIDTGTGIDTVNAGDGNNVVDIFAGSATTGSGSDVVRGGDGPTPSAPGRATTTWTPAAGTATTGSTRATT